MQKAKNCLKSLDFFSVDIGFNIKRKDEYGTMLGGLVFLLYVFLTVYFIIVNFITFIDRSVFNQNTIDTTLDAALPLNLLSPDIAYAFGITVNGKVNASYANYIDIGLLHVTVFKENSTKVKAPMRLVHCAKEHFSHLIDATFDSTGLSDYLCIDKDSYAEADTLLVQGIFTEEVYQYIEYSAKAGKDAEKKSDDFRDFFTNNDIQLQLYYLDTSIDVSNYTSPSTLYLNSIYIPLSFAFVFKMNIDVSNNTFENDAHILFRNPTFYDYFTIEKGEQLSTFLGFTRMEDKLNDYALFGRMYLRSSQYQKTIRRVYQKFTEFLADATSIVSQILFVIMLIMTAYNKFRAIESIIDRVMRYKQKLLKKSPSEFNLLKELFNSQTTDEETKGDNKQDKDKEKITLTSHLNTKSSTNGLIEVNSIEKHHRYSNCKPRKSIKAMTETPLFRIHNNYIFSNDNLCSPFFLRRQPIYTVFLPEKLKRFDIEQKEERVRSSLKYSMCDFVKLLFFKCGIKSSIKYKMKMLDKGMSYYLFNLDIFTYFTKMRELELIKYLLFNDHTSRLVDFLSKPSISYHTSKEEAPCRNSMEEFSMTIENIEKVSDSFKQVYNEYKETGNSDKRGEKLLQQTSYEIYQLIHD